MEVFIIVDMFFLVALVPHFNIFSHAAVFRGDVVEKEYYTILEVERGQSYYDIKQICLAKGFLHAGTTQSTVCIKNKVGKDK